MKCWVNKAMLTGQIYRKLGNELMAAYQCTGADGGALLTSRGLSCMMPSMTSRSAAFPQAYLAKAIFRPTILTKGRNPVRC